MALQDKTEAATPRRREESREEGKVARSTDISSAAVLLTALIIAKVSGKGLLLGMTEMTRHTFTKAANMELTIDALPGMFSVYGAKFILLCLPLIAGTAAVGTAMSVMQVGFKITPKAMALDAAKLDPIKGITKLFSTRSLVELVKSLVKIVVVAYFVYTFLKAELPGMLSLAGMPISDAWEVIASLCWRLAMRACIAMIVIGILDYIYQRYSFEKGLKMTKQEVKDEQKRTEGDPQVKSAIKRRQFEATRRRMIQAVAKADAVVTNPTHLAVAIKYDPDEMAAPIVVAKGQRLMAEKIKSHAAANGVPIIENKPVARLLYKVCEIGQAVPEELYQAVAEILAYVYSLGKNARKNQI